jgi:hypothetical protein
VYGFVRDVVQHGLNGEPCFEVDFSSHLDVQNIPTRDYEPWEAPLVTKEEVTAINSVVENAQVIPFRDADLLGLPIDDLIRGKRR